MKRFGIIGCGSIANVHADAINEIGNAELLAVYGRDKDKVNAFANKYQIEAYTDLNKMLQRDDIDAVTITTPSGYHLEPTIAAADHGKHIIVEKPLEINEERVNQMMTVCKKQNVILSGIYNRRYNPAVRALKAAVDGGRFGRIAMCDAQIKWYRDQAYYDSGAWRGTKSLDGGGALMNQGIHTIDLLLYFMSDVKRLSASTACLTHKNMEVEDSAVVILEFVNGARGVIQASTSCWSSAGHPAEIHICGDKGSVFLSDESFRVWDFKDSVPQDVDVRSLMVKGDQKGLGANDPAAINHLGHIKNFENFIGAIDGTNELEITGPECLKAIKLLDAIYNSTDNNGDWVELAPTD